MTCCQNLTRQKAKSLVSSRPDQTTYCQEEVQCISINVELCILTGGAQHLMTNFQERFGATTLKWRERHLLEKAPTSLNLPRVRSASGQVERNQRHSNWTLLCLHHRSPQSLGTALTELCLMQAALIIASDIEVLTRWSFRGGCWSRHSIKKNTSLILLYLMHW
jgi:hypothetical protein